MILHDKCEKCNCDMEYYGIDVILNKFDIYECTNDKCTYSIAIEPIKLEDEHE